MKRLIVVTILLLASFFVFPLSTHPANGQFTGVVCLTTPTSNKCPQVPFTFSNTPVGSNLAIGVFISGSDAMGGFDIYVKSDPSFLDPLSAALGPLIASPSLTSICVNNVSQTGACTANSANGPGVVEVTTAESSASNECGGISPCSGMAFTITYKVVSATTGTSIFFPSFTPPTGISVCTTTSVTSPPNVCVLVDDASGGTLPETTLAGEFTDQNPAANFAANPASGPVALVVGFDGTTSNATTGQSITNYVWSFGDGTPGANVTTGPTINHTYVTPGNYTPSLQVIDSAGLKSSIKDTLVIRVNCSFICASPSSLSLLAGGKANSTITLSGLDSFTGTITLSARVSPTVTNGPTATLSRPSVILQSGKTNTSVLTVSTTVSTPLGSYAVNVTGIVGALNYSIIVHVSVTLPDFSISANPSSLTISQGGNGVSTLSLTSIRGLNGNVALTLTNSSKYVLGFPANPTVKLTSTSGTNMSALYVLVQSGTPAGSYSINVTGTNSGPTGLLSHSLILTVTVPPPDFTKNATPTSITVKAGNNATSAVTFTGLNGFSDTINLQAKNTPNVGISTSFSPASVSINSTSGPATSTLTIITQGTTPTGTYVVTVNGTALNLHIQRFINITLTVILPVVPSIQVGAAVLSTVSATAGNPVAMTITASNTGTISVNVTITMDVNSGTGNNITVGQQTVTLTQGVASQTITLSWNTTQWPAGTYHVYARVIGSQTSAVNQAQSAGNVALSSPSAPPPPANLSVVPWVTTGVFAAIAALFGLLLFRRRRRVETSETAQ